MSSKLLISKFDNNEILKDDFKSMKKQIEEKQIRIKTAIKIEVRYVELIKAEIFSCLFS